MTQDDKKDDICICMYPHTRCPGHSSDTDLIISLQKQVADLRANAREIARRDLIAEIRGEVDKLEYCDIECYDVNAGFIEAQNAVLALLDKYTDPK